MGALDFLKDLQGKVVDAATYQLLERNFQMQSNNNRLLTDNNTLLKERVNELVARVAELEKENESLRESIRNSARDESFVEIEGLLWKKDGEGKFESKPRCPLCQQHPALFRFPPGGSMNWVCPKCDGTFDWATPPPL